MEDILKIYKETLIKLGQVELAISQLNENLRSMNDAKQEHINTLKSIEHITDHLQRTDGEQSD